MASPKPSKDQKAKKPAEKPEKKAVVETTPTVVANDEPSLKGFFARKCDKNENVMTIFKTPKIWGALIGEAIGTMLLTMLMLTLGVQPLYIVLATVGIYVAVVALSGAHLNPLITAGMMATRRISAIRGVLYMLAQVLGAWVGLIIVNSFRIGSGSSYELPMMVEIAGESFWMVALVELMGAMILAFCFARAIRYAKKSPLAFGMTIASAVTLITIFGIVITQSYFGFTGTAFMYNPAIALMYQILPTAVDGLGEFASLAGMALAGYVIFPVIGGILGFFISELATRLAGKGYGYTDYDCEQEG